MSGSVAYYATCLRALRRLGALRAGLVLGVASLVLVGACATDRGCSATQTVHGLQLEIAAELVPIRELDVRVCWKGKCWHGQPMTGIPRANAPQRSTVPVPHMPAGPITISGSYRREDGKRVTVGVLKTQAALVYPNGQGCPGVVPQARVQLTSSGFHALRV